MQKVIAIGRKLTLLTIATALLSFGLPLTANAAAYSSPERTYKHCSQYVWRQGDSGKCVKFIQHMFNYEKDDAGECGMVHNYPELKEDGQFGSKTVKAIKYLQTQCGLKANGVVNHATWKKLVPLN